ncbi:MAG: hypothetical protein M3N59_01845 [bacterium]|nr:hypothetical protein [bacterium]
MESYLFSVPTDGPYRWAASFLAPLLGVTIAVAAAAVCHYSNSPTIRRRFRWLRNVSFMAAILLAVYALLRAAGAPIVSYRVWLYLILVPYVLWLAWWFLRIRSLPHDLVVEREQRRKHGYRRRGKRRHR